MENKEALEGADLRKLETFLKDKDGNKVLGNLYRTVTDEVHVKWVYLQSRVSANQLHLTLGNSRSAHELDIAFGWACTGTDLLALENALRKSTVAILHVDLQLFRPSLSNKLSSISTRCEVHRLMNPPNMKSIHIVLPKDLLTLSNFTPKKPPHLRKLSYEIVVSSKLRIQAETVDCGSIVTTVYLQDSSIKLSRAQALSEALKTNSILTTLDLAGNSIGNGAQALPEALMTNSTLTTLDLRHNSIGERGAQALSEALKAKSTVMTLNLYDH
ncbi:hypothetical protein BGZ67_002957 [Mortierella alpina]|nr:hypothetical protein BGZ67_002957 [Mortierella alpina]